MDAMPAGAQFTIPKQCVLDKPISDDDFQKLNDETEIILLKGFARFEDVFGGEYTKRFGLFVSKSETQQGKKSKVSASKFFRRAGLVVDAFPAP
jgi:hypothetical protein